MKLRIIPYFLSQYLWIGIISLPLLSLVIWTPRVTTKDFFSQPLQSKFNDSEIPTWFLHGTDLHVNSNGNTSYINIKHQLNKSVNLLKPDKIILTGDIVDDRTPKGIRIWTAQNKKDWDVWKQILDELNLTYDPRLIQVAGNHDIYGIIRYNSSHHYADGVLYNYSDFLIDRVPLDIKGIKASILKINPYNFPTPTIGMTWFTTPEYTNLRKIIKEIADNTDDIQIIAQHHPSMMWYPNSGIDASVSYPQFLKRTSNVRMILCGHRHPEHPVYQHYGDVLEVVGTPWTFYHERVGLITYDNRRFSYHEVNMDDKHIAVMTAPTPLFQTSGLDIFSERTTRIRALYFGETPGNLSVRGSVNGTLNCSRQIKEKVWLCTLPVHFENGNHVLKKVGDWSGEVKFTIAPTIRGFMEDNYMNESSTSYSFLFAWLLIVCLVVTLPVGFATVGSAAENWIIGKSQNSNWLYAIFGGFILVRNRLYTCPYYIKIIAILATLWPLVLPICMFNLDGHPAMFWAWGFVADWRAMMQFEAMSFTLWYYYFVVLSFSVVCASIKTTYVRSWVHILDVCVFLAGMCGSGYMTYKLYAWFGIFSAITSPTFVLIPIVMLICVILYEVKALKSKDSANNELFDKTLVE